MWNLDLTERELDLLQNLVMSAIFHSRTFGNENLQNELDELYTKLDDADYHEEEDE